MTLIGYWPLNETEGDTAYDYSGNERHGHIVGDLDMSANGLLGESAYEGDGSEDDKYIDVAESDVVFFGDGVDFSVSFWFKIDTDQEDNHYIASTYEWGDRDSGWNISVNTNNNSSFGFFGRDETDTFRNIETSFPVDDGEWKHAVAIRRGTVWEIWINGEKVESEDQGSDGDMTGRELNIGRRPREGETVFDGNIAELRLYNRALSASEVQYLYNVSRRGRFKSRKKSA